MRSHFRLLLRGVFGAWIASSATAYAGALEVAPGVEAGAGYDGNFFLDEDAAARVQAYPLRGNAGVEAAWLPDLRTRVGARAGYTLQRLFADPPLGTLYTLDGGLDATWRPSFWSSLTAEGWAASNRTAGSRDIQFLDGFDRGGRFTAAYRLGWATLGAEVTLDGVDYAQQPVTTGVERSDTFAAAGVYAEWAAAGQWRAGLTLGRNDSNYHAAAYGSVGVNVNYGHRLWRDADAEAEAGWRRKGYEAASRADQRWRFTATLRQQLRDWLSVSAAAAQSLNRSNSSGNDYDWTTFECVVTARPHWSLLY